MYVTIFFTSLSVYSSVLIIPCLPFDTRLPASCHHTASDNAVIWFNVDLFTVFIPLLCVNWFRYIILGNAWLSYPFLVSFSAGIHAFIASLFHFKYSACFLDSSISILSFFTVVFPYTVPNNIDFTRFGNFSHCFFASSIFIFFELFVYLLCDIVSTGSFSYPSLNDFPRDCASCFATTFFFAVPPI